MDPCGGGGAGLVAKGAMKVLNVAIAFLSATLAAASVQQPLQADANTQGWAFDAALDFFGVSGLEVSSSVRALWDELELTVPDVVKTAFRKSEPASATRKTDWDFHVTSDRVKGELRIKKPKELGIDSVKQYSGYLDADDGDKHFFFWMFESRNDPKTDPVVLWLNGGPGCSSLTSLFIELGPSLIDNDTKPVYNNHSWNSNATVIFLDQPVNTGFSYSDKPVVSTRAASQDVYAFLTLFFQQFPEYSHLPFHIAGESYGGHFVPATATEILSHDDRNFNLTSVLIGNGHTDTRIQAASFEPMACGQGGYKPVLAPEQCTKLQNDYPTCRRLCDFCYARPSALSCIPAELYCLAHMKRPYYETGRNPYDIRENCTNGSLSLCYEEYNWVTKYLNQDKVKDAIGAEVDEFVSCSSDVGNQFLLSGDLAKPFHFHVANLLENGVPVLIYAGDKDYICNWLGNQAWVHDLDWSGNDSFNGILMHHWTIDDTPAGQAKNYGPLTFLRVFDAGHSVPYNQPGRALAMLNTWLSGDLDFVS